MKYCIVLFLLFSGTRSTEIGMRLNMLELFIKLNLNYLRIPTMYTEVTGLKMFILLSFYFSKIYEFGINSIQHGIN